MHFKQWAETSKYKSALILDPPVPAAPRHSQSCSQQPPQNLKINLKRQDFGDGASHCLGWVWKPLAAVPGEQNRRRRELPSTEK